MMFNTSLGPDRSLSTTPPSSLFLFPQFKNFIFLFSSICPFALGMPVHRPSLAHDLLLPNHLCLIFPPVLPFPPSFFFILPSPSSSPVLVHLFLSSNSCKCLLCARNCVARWRCDRGCDALPVLQMVTVCLICVLSLLEFRKLILNMDINIYFMVLQHTFKFCFLCNLIFL